MNDGYTQANKKKEMAKKMAMGLTMNGGQSHFKDTTMNARGNGGEKYKQNGVNSGKGGGEKYPEHGSGSGYAKGERPIGSKTNPKQGNWNYTQNGGSSK